MLVDKDTYNLIKNSNDLNLSSEDVQFLKVQIQFSQMKEESLNVHK